jgi:hypothetical protein
LVALSGAMAEATFQNVQRNFAENHRKPTISSLVMPPVTVAERENTGKNTRRNLEKFSKTNYNKKYSYSSFDVY